MPDNELDILIRLAADTHGAKAVEDSLKRVSGETQKTVTATKESTAATKQSTAAIEDSTKATEKTITAKRQWRDALRGIGLEIPILGRLAGMLNPITLGVAGIIGAFRLWRLRVDELSKSLAGFEMPDVSNDQITRIDAGAAALGRFAVEMAKVEGASKLVKDDLANVVRTIKIIDELRKAAGLDTGTKAAETEAAAKDAAATRLEQEARAKIAAGGTPGSPEAEAALGALYKKAAEDAMKAQATSRERLMQIGEMQNAPTWRRPYDDWRFRIRYGVGTTYDEARAMEQGNIESSQRAIDQFRSFRQGSAARQGRRAMIETGNADLSEVSRLRQEVSELRAQLGINRTKSAASTVQTFGSDVSAAIAIGDLGRTAILQLEYTKALVTIAQSLAAAKAAEREILGNQRRN